MIFESGEKWYLTSGLVLPSIAVIEKHEEPESYDEHHERRKREEANPPQRVPFGFGPPVETAGEAKSSAQCASADDAERRSDEARP